MSNERTDADDGGLVMILIRVIGVAFAISTVTADGETFIQPSQIRFVGSFDVPQNGSWRDPPAARYDYSSGTIGYRDDLDALYVVTHSQDARAVGLIKVPKSFSAEATAVAKQIDAPARLRAGPDRESRLRGMFWDTSTSTLFYHLTVWYNVEGTDAPGLAAVKDLGTEQPKFSGPWFAGHNNATAGYITQNPKNGKFLVGNSVGTGVATSSLGPSVFQLELDTRDLPAPRQRIFAKPLLWHRFASRGSKATDFAIQSSGKRWFEGMEMLGGVCVGPSLIVAVDEGSQYFYGTPDAFKQQHGVSPRGGGKGTHHDPYLATLWFYSIASLEGKEKDSKVRDPSDPNRSVRPYAYHRLVELPANARLGGITYDRKRQRIFISQSLGNDQNTPRIYVYQLEIGSS